MRSPATIAIVQLLAVLCPLATHARAIADAAPLEARDGPGPDTLTIETPPDKVTSRDLESRSSNGTLSARDVAGGRAINTCPTGWDFVTSYCTRATPQSYTLRCNEDDGLAIAVQNYPGTCAPTEICIDGIASSNHPLTAYCVSSYNFVKLAAGHYGGQEFAVRISFPPGFASNANLATEVVLSGADDGTVTYQAQHLQIEAQDTNKKTLSGGFNQCDSCSSIGIEPWPQGTDTMLATFSYKGANDAARLYEASIVPGTGF